MVDTVKNFKKWSHVIPFSNCILRFEQKNNILLSRICSYTCKDTVTNAGTLGYSINIAKFLETRNNAFKFDGVRYPLIFVDYIKTLFGCDPYNGHVSIFGWTQFICFGINLAAAMLRTKLLQKMLVLLGSAGLGYVN